MCLERVVGSCFFSSSERRGIGSRVQYRHSVSWHLCRYRVQASSRSTGRAGGEEVF